MGMVGRYEAADYNQYSRDTRVVCRTERGLEVGKVLCAVDSANKLPISGTLLRQLGNEDKMILDRLDKFRDRAFAACQAKLAERQLNSILVDVEHLFDGESVFFYFLGEMEPELEAVTEELAETYDRKVRFKKFAETLAQGCGPGCGTTASKCGSEGGGCASCSLAGGCGSK